MSANNPSKVYPNIKIQIEETEPRVKIQTETETRNEGQSETETRNEGQSETETRNERQSETEMRNERPSEAAVTAAVKPSILKPPMPRPSVATTSIKPVSLRSSTRKPLSVRSSVKRLSRATTSTGTPTIEILSKERPSTGTSSVKTTTFKKQSTDKPGPHAKEKSPAPNFRDFRSVTEGDDIERRTPKKVFHPFSCRLNTRESNYWENLIQVVFAVWTLGILTVFRFSFALLLLILFNVKVSSSEFELVKRSVLMAVCIWFATVAVVMFPLGLIPLLAASIKKRWVLVIHPWALMVMYFDFAVWLTVTTILFLKLLEVSHSSKETLRHVQQTYFFFALIYTDIIVFFFLHYVYITYYIVAELTVIEEFY